MWFHKKSMSLKDWEKTQFILPCFIETAEVVYEECDGTEFELSGNSLDLRYIPDDMEFDHEPQSVATELPVSGSYTAPE